MKTRELIKKESLALIDNSNGAFHDPTKRGLRQIDIIIPSSGMPHFFDCIRSLEYLPFRYKLYVVQGNTWAEAVNMGFRKGLGDVILMGDDVRISPNTFADFHTYEDKADIFGFKLLREDGTIQHAGGFCKEGRIGHYGYGSPDLGYFDIPYYCCHLTASLLYIKREVIRKLDGMDEAFCGIQYEDVDFSFRAIMEGFKLLYLPNSAIHLEIASKIEGKEDLVRQNYKRLQEKYTDPNLFSELNAYPRPYTIWNNTMRKQAQKYHSVENFNEIMKEETKHFQIE